ncbi:MAG TPA: hypothetical protein VIJ25_15645, partial [Methylococcales bacterium]
MSFCFLFSGYCRLLQSKVVGYCGDKILFVYGFHDVSLFVITSLMLFFYNGQWHRSKEQVSHLITSNHANEFAHSRVHQYQHRQEDLDGPEMRPYDLREQFLVTSDETACLSPEVDETLQGMDEHGYQNVERGLPGNVKYQRFAGVA